MTYKEERPWGSFEILHEEEGLKVKRIIVNPGKRLSLQSHKYRSENWILLRGNAVVTLDRKTIPLSPNGTIYIPANRLHRIANQGSDEVIFIEIQKDGLIILAD